MLQNRLELVGSRCKIKKPVAARAAFLVDFVETFGQLFVTGLVCELALMIEDRLRKHFPYFIAHRLARKFARGFFELAPELVVTFLSSREPDDRHRGWQVAIGSKVVKRWDEFALGEIAGRAENHNTARLRHAARGQTFA